MLGATSNEGKQPAAVKKTLDVLFGDDVEDGADAIRLIGMELPNMRVSADKKSEPLSANGSIVLVEQALLHAILPSSVRFNQQCYV